MPDQTEQPPVLTREISDKIVHAYIKATIPSELIRALVKGGVFRAPEPEQPEKVDEQPNQLDVAAVIDRIAHLYVEEIHGENPTCPISEELEWGRALAHSLLDAGLINRAQRAAGRVHNAEAAERRAASWWEAAKDWCRAYWEVREALSNNGARADAAEAKLREMRDFHQKIINRRAAERDEAREKLGQVRADRDEVVGVWCALSEDARDGVDDIDVELWRALEKLTASVNREAVGPVTDREEPAYPSCAVGSEVELPPMAERRVPKGPAKVTRYDPEPDRSAWYEDADGESLKLECPDYHCAHSYEQTGPEYVANDVSPVHHRLWDHLVTVHGTKCVGGVEHKEAQR